MTGQKKKGTVLVVDDEPDIRDSLADCLSWGTEKVILAENGLAALKILETEKVDAVLSDINMPKMDGIAFLKKVREMGNQVPFVILTGHGDKKLAVEALKSGAFEFLDKPWDDDHVAEVMGRAVELGSELNYWSTHPDMVQEISATAEESSQKSAAELTRIIGLLTKENLELKKKIQ